jgi:5-oxopent-3-ene-1,2,5-tricarboxylate decarboxylase/2-hydroxyhepta-2,4-diene-1,7-dioate isomerase
VSAAKNEGWCSARAARARPPIPESSYYRPTVKQRCRDGFVLWARVAAVLALPDTEAIEIRISANGSVPWTASTSTLIRSIPRPPADVTEFMTLDPGDMLLTGEPFHSPLVGPAYTVRVEVAGIGTLENQVVAEVPLSSLRVFHQVTC